MRKLTPTGPYLKAICIQLISIACIGVLAGQAGAAQSNPFAKAEARMALILRDAEPAFVGEVRSATPCVNGVADGFPCHDIDLLAWMPTNTIGSGTGNDVWGWTDPLTGKEYALMGRTNGTAFVDVSDPENPLYLADLPTETGNSAWRDIKVYADHAFIVSDFNGAHGMQVFDLTRLRTIAKPPETVAADAVYDAFNRAHNIVINETSGFAYLVGAETCGGGLHMLDISTPTSPSFAGCFDADGYTHDAQCVNYIGPDPDYQGHEICLNSNEDTLTIVDVTDKENPAQVARETYAGVGYTHQGWLTEDHQYFLLDDEYDERDNGHNTRTRIWDVRDLDAPLLIGVDDGSTTASDHNQYIHEGRVYQANYRAGLRVHDGAGIPDGTLTEIAWFDTYPENDGTNYNAAWSVYPFFESGTLLVSAKDRGLFVLRLNDGSSAPDADGDGISDDLDNCTLLANPQQIDSNEDGFGNVCDADIGGAAGAGLDDCLINFLDLGFLKAAFFSAPGDANWNPHADFTGGPDGEPDATINFLDLGRMKSAFFQAPGPSATECE